MNYEKLINKSKQLRQETFLTFINQTPFNFTDPIFMKEVSFYIFSLPFYSLILSFLISCVVMTSIFVLLDYMKSYMIQLFKNFLRVPIFVHPNKNLYYPFRGLLEKERSFK